MSSEKQAFELARFVATLKENLPAHMELAELNAKSGFNLVEFHLIDA